MKRGGYLKRHTPLRRKTRLRPINPERRARVHAEAFGKQSALCRELPCCVCGAPPPSDPAHVRSRGAGGKDRGNVVSLCRSCHNSQHSIGIKTFQAKHGVDLEAIAREIEGQAYGE